MQLAELAQSSIAIVCKVNEFQEPNPVVFSATPGQLTETVPMPGFTQRKVGPLCRRSVLAFKQLRMASGTFTLSTYLDLLRQDAFDAGGSAQPVTNWDRVACAFAHMQLK